MWHSWNLLMYLLRHGSFTLMSIPSLVVLVVVCDSQSIMEKLINLVW